MGLMGQVLGRGGVAAVGEAAEGLSEVFLPNATREMELSQEAYALALGAAMEEFRTAGSTRFDRFVNGLNRLPRPFMALGTLALFVFSMVDPAAFSRRMEGLALVPEPLWWLLGAIVGFYFGARELHYRRIPRIARGPIRAGGLFRRRRAAGIAELGDPADSPGAAAEDTSAPDNPALSDWFARRGD